MHWQWCVVTWRQEPRGRSKTNATKGMEFLTGRWFQNVPLWSLQVGSLRCPEMKTWLKSHHHFILPMHNVWQNWRMRQTGEHPTRHATGTLALWLRVSPSKSIFQSTECVPNVCTRSTSTTQKSVWVNWSVEQICENPKDVQQWLWSRECTKTKFAMFVPGDSVACLKLSGVCQWKWQINSKCKQISHCEQKHFRHSVKSSIVNMQWPSHCCHHEAHAHASEFCCWLCATTKRKEAGACNVFHGSNGDNQGSSSWQCNQGCHVFDKLLDFSWCHRLQMHKMIWHQQSLTLFLLWCVALWVMLCCVNPVTMWTDSHWLHDTLHFWLWKVQSFLMLCGVFESNRILNWRSTIEIEHPFEACNFLIFHHSWTPMLSSVMIGCLVLISLLRDSKLESHQGHIHCEKSFWRKSSFLSSTAVPSFFQWNQAWPAFLQLLQPCNHPSFPQCPVAA